MSRLGDTLMGMDGSAGRPIPLGGLPGVVGAVVRRRRGTALAAVFLLCGILTIMMVAVMVHAPRSTQPSPTLPVPLSGAQPVPPTRPAPIDVLPSPAPRPAAPAPRSADREGVAAAQRGAFDEAVRLFERALQANPRDAETWNNLGVALTRQGDVAGGIEAFRKAIALDASRAETHRNVAVALERQGQDREAARHYRAFLSLVPEGHPDRAAIRQRLAAVGTK